MQYKVVIGGATSAEKAVAMLVERLDRDLRDGWVPTGGVAWIPVVDKVGDQPFLTVSQAVTKD